MLQDNELQLYDVVWVHPVLGRLADEVLLLAAGARIALDGVAARTDDVIEPRQLEDI